MVDDETGHNESEENTVEDDLDTDFDWNNYSLPKEVKKTARSLSQEEIRGLVSTYYTSQNDRIRANNRLRKFEKASERESPLLRHFASVSQKKEDSLKLVLAENVKHNPVGKWLITQKGVGPVIAAGLLAHISIEDTRVVQRIWRFAGLDPTVAWNKGERRPWNADLKKLCYLLGESFVKVSGYEDAYYAQVYLRRKIYEWKNNREGKYADQAREKTDKFRITDEATLKWYKGGYSDVKWETEAIGESYRIIPGSLIAEEASGGNGKLMLPPGRIHMRAKRYAVKIFLSHLHHVWYKERYGEDPPKPFILGQMGHTHYMPPPGIEVNYPGTIKGWGQSLRDPK